MNKVRALVLGAGLAALAAGAACVVTVWWQGGESTIRFDWTVNGASPATACATVGASRVRMWISQSLPSCTLDSGSCGLWQPDWDWSCTDGTATTSMQFSPVELYVGWELLDDADNVLRSTAWQRFSLQSGDNYLGTQDFALAPVPTGDAAVVSTWTIDGNASGSASCAAAGAATVSLTWRETGATDEQTAWWTCDTTVAATTGDVFQSGGSYDLRWTLLSDTGASLSTAPGPDLWSTQTLAAGDNPFRADFVTTTLPDASVSTTWTISSRTADAASCGAANAASVVLVFQESGGVPSAIPFDCTDGASDTGAIFYSGRTYQLRWELRTGSDVLLAAAPDVDAWQTVVAAAGDNPFEVDLPVLYGRLDATLQWADKVSSPAWGDCALPPHPVASLGYLLESTAGVVYSRVDIDTAPVACTTALAWVGVPFGDLHLIVDGRAAAPATATWNGDCTGLVVDDLLDNAFTCQVPMVTP